MSRKLRKQRWECTDAQRALDPLSCRRKWNLIKERATLLNGQSKPDEVDVLRDFGRARPVWEARHSEKFVAWDLCRWRRCKYLLIAPRATDRVRCKPTLQNRTTLYPHGIFYSYHQVTAISVQAGRKAGKQSGKPTTSLAYSVYAELTVAAFLSLVGRESAECFVNSWRSAERRAEGANREARFRSGAAAPRETGYLTTTESHCSTTSVLLRRDVASAHSWKRNVRTAFVNNK